jgi:hypothetical protein
MSAHQTSSKGSFTVGKLAGTMVAAGALLFAAPAAVAFADPLGDTVNNVNNIVRGNVEGTNNILRGNVFGGNGILQGNVFGGNNILQGNVNNTNLILRGLFGLH